MSADNISQENKNTVNVVFVKTLLMGRLMQYKITTVGFLNFIVNFTIHQTKCWNINLSAKFEHVAVRLNTIVNTCWPGQGSHDHLMHCVPALLNF